MKNTAPNLLPSALLTLLLTVPPEVLATDPAVLWEELRSTRLDPDRAVEVGGLTLRAGVAALRMDQGILFPATPVGDRSVEMVFTGRARLIPDPPDDVEADQLEARLAIRAGEYDRACKLLRKSVLRRGDRAGTEGLLLLAIAARETGHRSDYETAVEAASEKGAAWARLWVLDEGKINLRAAPFLFRKLCRPATYDRTALCAPPYSCQSPW